MQTTTTSLKKLLLPSYAQLFFVSTPWIGALTLICMLWVPWVLLGSALAWATCTWVSQSKLSKHPLFDLGLLGYNSILTGGWLGMVVEPNAGLLAAAAAAGLLCAWLQWIWLKHAPEGLSFLSWPFIISASAVTLCAKQIPGFFHVATFPPYPIFFSISKGTASALDIGFWCKHFLVSMGSVPFLPLWPFGFILCAALAISHRNLLKCILVAWLAGSATQIFISNDAFFLLNIPVGFNFMLMGMAWHTFFPPLKVTWPWLAVASSACGIMLIPAQQFANLVGLSTFSLPFSTIMLICLLILRQIQKHQRV